jgi:hypothetical protein
MFIYEYHDSLGPWFDLNPVLTEAEKVTSLTNARTKEPRKDIR